MESQEEWRNGTLVQPVKVEPKIGMTADQVRASSWGEPREVNRTQRRNSTHEQWVYGYGYQHRYLYLDDGVLTTIQDSQ
jgi:hypothetical protein